MLSEKKKHTNDHILCVFLHMKCPEQTHLWRQEGLWEVTWEWRIIANHVVFLLGKQKYCNPRLLQYIKMPKNA